MCACNASCCVLAHHGGVTRGRYKRGESENSAWQSKHVDLSDSPGPIHDAQWSPTAADFVVVYGVMPSKTVLFNRQGESVFCFGRGNHNQIVWSPHGRFMCLGGFGNLAGSMRFWDVSQKLALGSATARCAIYRSFSPCSRYFLTAVTFPSLRVDNELALWRYDGSLVYRERVRVFLLSPCKHSSADSCARVHACARPHKTVSACCGLTLVVASLRVGSLACKICA